MAVRMPKTADSEARRRLFGCHAPALLGAPRQGPVDDGPHPEDGGAHRRAVALGGRAQQAKQQLERARELENAAIDRLPYTREQLRQALDDLAKKKTAAR
jgi:hypothetical protein